MRTPWNKGLTKNIDERVKRNGLSVSKALRTEESRAKRSEITKKQMASHPLKGRIITWGNKISQALKGRKITWSNKISQTKKGRRLSEEHKTKISLAQKGRNYPWLHTPEAMRKSSDAKRGKIPIIAMEKARLVNLGKHHSIERRKKISQALKGHHYGGVEKGRKYGKEYGERMRLAYKRLSEEAKNAIRLKQSLTRKLLWQDPKYVAKIMKSRGVKPNKVELRLQSLLNSVFPEEWKFVGDGQLIIGGKCPDFANVNGKKALIELYGAYWHSEQKPQDRINKFAEYGYKCLVIWDKELENEEAVLNRVRAFNG